ncbi:MAG TPA: biopolymer transporter ExbD [Pirellulales bacterium]|jgi:biopolymer transport protein ExbD|nr:biopolymer transporter ExbD [Pirellulales bacterium]
MPLKIADPEEPTLNLTPMIDVILTLVIFFMVATKFTDEEKAMSVKVPSVSSQQAVNSAAEPKVVNVFADGHILLGTQPVSLDDLTQQLAAAHGQYHKLSVLVRGDRDTTHGRMTEVYDACRRAGITEVAISVKVGAKQR